MLLRPSGASPSPAGAWDPPTHKPVLAGTASRLHGQSAAGHPAGRRPGPVRRGVRLAVDVGSVRIGVARSDPDGVLASPLTVVRSGPGDLDALADLAASAGPIEVVVGLPTSLSGREGAAAVTARRFAARLAGRLAPVPVRLFDERFTTTTAHAALRRGGKDSRARRSVVDAAAAAVLLQAALDAERATGRPPGQPVSVGAEASDGEPGRGAGA